MASIDLRRLSKRYPDGHDAVRELSLTVADGELVVLVGPSGCGKTTALRMIAGLESITAGELYIGDRMVNDLSPKERDIAMVFQSYALYPHMTIRENIAFSLRLAKRPADEIDRAVREAASLLDLEPHLDRLPAQLSGGQRQRVAMGRAIVREPAAFLMDEPLSNLDAKLRVTMRAQLAQLQRSLGTTTVYVTHDQVEAMTLGHRVAVLREGVLQQVDEPLAVYTNPVNLFVATFIGSPAMNLFDGAVEDGSVQTPLGVVSITSELRSRIKADLPREVIVGIRPEDLSERSDVGIDASYYGGRLDVQIEVVEAVGSDIFVHFQNPSTRAREVLETAQADAAPKRQPSALPLAVARVSPFSRIAVGEHTTFSIDARRVHLFDARTGESLLSGENRLTRPRAGSEMLAADMC